MTQRTTEAEAATMRADADFLVGTEFYAKYREQIGNPRDLLHREALAQFNRVCAMDAHTQGCRDPFAPLIGGGIAP